MEGGELFQRIQDKQAFNERGNGSSSTTIEIESSSRGNWSGNDIFLWFIFQRQRSWWKIFASRSNSYMIWTWRIGIWNRKTYFIHEKVFGWSLPDWGQLLTIFFFRWLWSPKVNGFRVRQGDSYSKYSTNPLLHTLLRCTRGSRTGKIRQILWCLVIRRHHVHLVSLPKSQTVWKLLKMSYLDFSILAFSTNFCPFKIDLSGNTVWPLFSKLAKIDHFLHF